MSRAHLISPAALLLLREPHSSQRSDALTAHLPLKESHCKARRCLVLERDPREAVPVPQPSVAREVEPVHWRLGKWVGVSGRALVGGFSIPGAQPPLFLSHLNLFFSSFSSSPRLLTLWFPLPRIRPPTQSGLLYEERAAGGRMNFLGRGESPESYWQWAAEYLMGLSGHPPPPILCY